MFAEPRIVVREIVRCIESLDRVALAESRRGDGYEIKAIEGVIRLGADRCSWVNSGVEIVLSDKASLAFLRDRIVARLSQEDRGSPSGSPTPIEKMSGLVRAESLTESRFDELCAKWMKPNYSHDEVFGSHCFLTGHIEAPYDVVFDYCADPLSLTEWTINIRQLKEAGNGLYRGHMVFSAEDAARPGTEIFIRADTLKGPEQGLICYPCAWDQGDELWMRYYFILADAKKTIDKTGTVVLWVNCKHPYYDRSTSPVPRTVEQGRARTDRPWAGDGWPLFYPLHQLELSNLKTIIESRYPGEVSPRR